MQISAAAVKELRERSGAGMMECKNALVATNGDLDELKDTVIGEDGDDSEIEIEPDLEDLADDAAEEAVEEA